MSGLLASGTFGGHAAQSRAASAACWLSGGPLQRYLGPGWASIHELEGGGRLEEQEWGGGGGGRGSRHRCDLIYPQAGDYKWVQTAFSSPKDTFASMCVFVDVWSGGGVGHKIGCSFINSSVSAMKGWHRSINCCMCEYAALRAYLMYVSVKKYQVVQIFIKRPVCFQKQITGSRFFMVIKRAVFTDLVLHLISVDLLNRAAHYCSSTKAFISAVLLFISAQISISSTHFLSINESCNLVFLETGDKICLRTL